MLSHKSREMILDSNEEIYFEFICVRISCVVL